VLYPVRDKLELEKLNFQVLRRTFATRASDDRRGTPVDIQKHLRHARVSTTVDNYIKGIPESVSRMVDAMYEDMVPLTKGVQ
jgi:integrase